MSSRQHEEEGLTAKTVRLALMGMTTAGVGSTLGHGLDGAFPGADPVDVTGLHGAHVDDGSVLHHGPAEGGDLLDRPSAGYMAHSSAGNGMELQQGNEITTIARDIDKAGTFSFDGQEISVLDYVPGGDYVQMAAGNVNPSQIAMGLLHHGMEREMQVDGAGTPDTGGQLRLAGQAPRQMEDGTELSSIHEGGVGRSEGSEGPAIGGDGSETSSYAMAGTAGAKAVGAKAVGAGHTPDADEDARDMEALAIQHRLDLDTAVETSDQQTVHTEIHAHGRTLEVDTNFEATAPDNREEREEAAEHVQEMAHSALSETENSRPDMHFRSRVQAHLDAQARDEGMSI